MFEINEAFAAQELAATEAILTVKALYELRRTGKKTSPHIRDGITR